MDEKSDEKNVNRNSSEDVAWDSGDILKLAVCWALTLTTSTLLTAIGPLSAKHVGASDVLAPFTVGIFLVGAAVSSVPSGWLFRKYGRYGGFALGCLFQVIGSAAGSIGMTIESEGVLYIGCFSVGLAQGLGQFYRFAAVEISPDNFKSSAVTYVLSGGIIAAVLGPTSASYTVSLIGKKYVGSFITMTFIGAMNYFVLATIKFPSSKTDATLNSTLPSRPMMVIIKQPLFIISCAIPTIAHTVMIMVMSNCSISMEDDFSFSTQTIVLEGHFLAMFLPGFFTGWLISKYGAFKISILGGIVFGMSGVAFLIGKELWNYFVGMALIGIAWNFSFSAGTVMLTGCYTPQEATDVQAVNDFILFTIAGAGSLISGVIFSVYGWFVLIYASLAMMVLYMALFGVAKYIKTVASDSPVLLAQTDYHEPLLEDDDYKSVEREQSRLKSWASVSSESSMSSIDRVRQMSVA